MPRSSFKTSYWGLRQKRKWREGAALNCNFEELFFLLKYSPVVLIFFYVGVFPPEASKFEEAFRESNFLTSSLKQDVKYVASSTPNVSGGLTTITLSCSPSIVDRILYSSLSLEQSHEVSAVPGGGGRGEVCCVWGVARISTPMKRPTPRTSPTMVGKSEQIAAPSEAGRSEAGRSEATTEMFRCQFRTVC
jgi:hypothetical protein